MPGRGHDYSRARGLWEGALRRLYRGGWPAALWAQVPGATSVRLVERRLAVLPAGAPSVRLGFASDLHIGPTTPPALLNAAEAALREARVDVLLLGGDYVFLEATDATGERLSAFVRGVGAAHTFAVLGNHDLWTDHPRLEAALTGAGATLLVNAAARVGDVIVVGVDDPWTGEPDAERALGQAAQLGGDTDGARRPVGAGHTNVGPALIGLVHAPEGAPALSGRVDVIFCGHTHGGQIALPGGRVIVAPGPKSRAWPHGEHRLGRTTLLVSRGIGGIELPVRAFAPPDVLVVDLVAQGRGAPPA